MFMPLTDMDKTRPTWIVLLVDVFVKYIVKVSYVALITASSTENTSQ